METGRVQRTVIGRLGVMLCVALLGGCATPHLKMQLPDDHEWDGWRTANDSRKTQHLPVGETMEDWSERIEVNIVYRPIVGASTPMEWLDDYKGYLGEDHPGETVISLFLRTERGPGQEEQIELDCSQVG